YMSGTLRSHERRMDFVRFTGEWFIYFALLALGGGVLMGITVAILTPAGVDAEAIMEWVLPMGAAGAVIVAAWLVESKAAGHREHGTGADDGLHPSVRGHAGHRRDRLRRDRFGWRLRPGTPRRVRPAPGRGPGTGPV